MSAPEADPSSADTGPTAEQLIARLALAADDRYLVPALAFIREAAGALGLEAPHGVALARAVEEVAANVIQNAFEPGQQASFDIVVLRRPGRLIVAVEDQGLPFDFEALQARGASHLSDTSALAGFADAVHFENRGTGGNRVEIVKRLPFRDIEAYPAVPGQPVVTAGPAEPVTLRLMTPEDAVAVARCTYAVYGYTVPDDYLYFPDHLREMLEGGLLEVCVGVTPSGEVVSCLTREVDRPGAPVGYLGEGMVIPRFRHRGLLDQMLGFLLGQAAEQGMRGLYAEAVTVHLFSQKGNLARGGVETGVQLADEAPVVFRQMAEGAPSRRTATVLIYMKTSDGPPRTVHLPARHRAIAQRIYGRLGLPRDVRPAPAAGPDLPAASRVKVDVFPAWSEASIRVAACGRDLPALVRFRLRELQLRRIDWISLDLPLSDPGTAELCAPLETLGFFFAGIIPELGDGDVLRLQYLNEVEVDLDSVQLASEFGKEIFDYVVAAMRA
jgi:serine/threonine-protein kinase RsbW